MKKISTKPASGFRDYLPNEMMPRQKMLDTVRTVFERFGFAPIDTPAIEREEVLTGGDPNFKKEIFRTNKEKGDSPLALRFDLTVPLARVMAEHKSDIKKPFKRYHIGKVWRGERPQAGRYREFMQCDADIVGSSSMMADAEIIALIDTVLQSLGISKFTIRINNRKILEGLIEHLKVPKKKTSAVLRSVDKLEKQGRAAVMKELLKEGLEKEQAEKIVSFLEFRGKTAEDTLAFAEKTLGPKAREGVGELSEITKHLAALDVPRERWKIDLSIARGLGYYTGSVFEAVLDDAREFGSVFGGGRYDGLVGKFSNDAVPAVGASAGIDRLFAALETSGGVTKEGGAAKVLVLNFDPSAGEYVQRVASVLRANEVSTELYLGNEATLKGQLAYALQKEIPVVVIAGGEEMEKNVVQVKDLKERKQEEVSFGEIVFSVKNIFKSR